jgi:hypothetical protein
MDSKIAAWDIEASCTADGDFKAYGVGLAWYGPDHTEEYVQFWGLTCLEEFAQWLVEHLAQFNKWTFYAHNGGRFDIALLLKESLLKKCGLHIKGASAIELNGCWINIPLHDEVGNEIIMKDSLRMLPGSLADLTAQLKVKHQKLAETVSHDDITLDNWHTFPALKTYLEHDCKGLLEVMHQFNSDVFAGFGIPMTKCFTSASLAKKAFFQGFYNRFKFPIYSLPQSMDAYLRKGYFGGRVECFHMGKVPANKIYYYDFTSLFPNEGCKALPFGKPVLQSAELIMPTQGVISRNFFGFARCMVRTLDREAMPMHAVKADGKLMFPILADWHEMTLFSEEIRAGIAKGLYEYRVLDGYAFDKAPILAKFFKKGFEEKARAAAEDKPALSQANKIVINSGYGFWGIRTESRDAVVCITKDGIAELDIYEDAGKLKHVGYIGEYIMARVEKDLPVEDFNVSIAAAITSYARMKLYSAMTAIQSKGHSVFYCDTDSIMTDCNLSKYPDLMAEFMWDGCGDALGALKNEADGKVKKALKAAGVNLTVEEVRAREGGMIHFDELVLNGSKFYCIQKSLPELSAPMVISKAKGFKAARDSTLTFADQIDIANGTPAEQIQMQFRLPRTAMCCEEDPFKLSKVMVKKSFSKFYDKGTVLANGRIAPLVY